MTYLVPRTAFVSKMVPSTGSTISIPAQDTPSIIAMINNVGLLLALTINLPVGASPGQILRVTFNGAITAVIWGGAANNGGLTAALGGGYVVFVWDDTNNIWRRCG